MYDKTKDITERLTAIFPPDEPLSGRECAIQDLSAEAAIAIHALRAESAERMKVIRQLLQEMENAGIQPIIRL